MKDLCKNIGMSPVHVAIAWLFKKEAVGSVLAGARNKKQAVSNAEAGTIEIDDSTEQELDQIFGTVKELTGTNPDMWKRGTDSRYK